jgi:formate dehydrogenase iron-sulfur subunit
MPAMSAITEQPITVKGRFHELPVLPPAPPGGAALIAHLMRDQQQMTAVEQFVRREETDGRPSQAKSYARLMPATPPREGQQYAFEVDLDRCSGCKACVTACHSLNGLDEGETWRDVGLLVGGTAANPVMQHVTTACHHCLEPACLIACPVNAYEKHPETGIVKHLDDQCFGCRYCTLACPYDVPKYHAGKGIVRKCDMCSDRLAVGEAPACVQACPHEAISITVVDKRQVIEDSEAHEFLPAAPEPYLTFPTTNYKSRRVFPRNTLPADYHSVSPQHPHWPLIVMLVLTQLSVGGFVVGQLLERVIPRRTAFQGRPDDAGRRIRKNSAKRATDGRIRANSATAISASGWTALEGRPAAMMRPVHATMALLFGLLALGASVFHLGRPLYAFRAVLGLRHSWLSREIVAFGLFASVAGLYAAGCWTAGPQNPLLEFLGWCVVATGTAGVFCSVMIYVFTKREFWNASQTGVKFALTASLLGIAAAWLTLLILGVSSGSPETARLLDAAGPMLARGLVVATGLKLAFEASLFTHLLSHRASPLNRSARLMAGPLSNVTLARFAAGLLGGIVMPLFLLADVGWAVPTGGAQMVGTAHPTMLVIVSMLFVACLAGELLERYLFFAAVSSPRMPGGLRT